FSRDWSSDVCSSDLSRNPSARIGLQGSEQGYWRGSVDVSGGDDLDSGASLGGRLSGYVSRRNGGWQDHNDAEKESLSLRGDWQPDRKSDVEGKAASD